MTHVDDNPLPPAFILSLFSLIVVLSAADLRADHLEGASATHIALEVLIVVLACIGAGALFRQVNAARRESRALNVQLADTRRAAEHWRAESEELLAGLGVAIDRQFGEWHLTAAEREVGLLVLKGLSHKAAATVRGVSERTVREQARQLYRKAGLSGRADLSAYFLEDLLLPSPGAPERRAPDDVPA